jgi:uncharacterized protein (TIGR02996 family)
VTTEDDFHAALDAEPDDWHARLVFADFLEERGDPRAAGYRALGTSRKRPGSWDNGGYRTPPAEAKRWGWWDDVGSDTKPDDLPTMWFRALTGGDFYPQYLRYYPRRRDAEDAAALAFLTLAAELRAKVSAPRDL